MIETVAHTASTNADLLARVNSGDLPDEGFWLRAETQSGGRGRLNRQWVSPPGNLYCSTVVNVRPSDPPAHSLSFVASLAVHDAVAQYVDPARLMLKWPNDVLLEGGKLSGILAERSGDHVVVGIGINLASAPDLPDRTTAALADILTDAPEPAHCLDRLAGAFALRLKAWRDTSLSETLSEWRARGHPVATPLNVTNPDGTIVQGEYTGLTDEGGLQLRLADGSLTVIHSGDISVA